MSIGESLAFGVDFYLVLPLFVFDLELCVGVSCHFGLSVVFGLRSGGRSKPVGSHNMCPWPISLPFSFYSFHFSFYVAQVLVEILYEKFPSLCAMKMTSSNIIAPGFIFFTNIQ